MFEEMLQRPEFAAVLRPADGSGRAGEARGGGGGRGAMAPLPTEYYISETVAKIVRRTVPRCARRSHSHFTATATATAIATVIVAAIAQSLRSHCAAIAQPLRSHCAATAQPLPQSSSQPLRSQSHSHCAAIATAIAQS